MGAFTIRRILAVAVLALGASDVAAQTPLKAWPEPQPQMQPQQQQRAWPGDAPQPASAPAAAPMTAPAPMMMAPPQMQGPGGGGMSMGGPPQGNAQACSQEFMRLKGEVEKKGAVAKAVNDRKGTREEMCSAITAIHGAQVNWVKWTQGNSAKCGIPDEVLKQLKLGQANLAKLRTGICSAGPAAGGGGAPATPRLSDALGTDRLPPSSSEATKKRGGVLDTMTGTAIR